VHIDALVRRQIEHVAPQDLSERSDDDDVRLIRAQLVHDFSRLERRRLHHRHAARQG